jgi:hypothetical protein
MGTKVEAAARPRVGGPASAVEAELADIQGSAPSFCAELMLRHKAIHHRRVKQPDLGLGRFI